MNNKIKNPKLKKVFAEYLKTHDDWIDAKDAFIIDLNEMFEKCEGTVGVICADKVNEIKMAINDL